jgi:hypothetical protein
MTGERDEEFVEQAEARLDRLEHDIAEAREHSEEAVEGTFHDEPEHRFVDSGDERAKREDDQTIAPG